VISFSLDTQQQMQCYCGAVYEDEIAMIRCDNCLKWFHCSCVGLTEEKAKKSKGYVCIKCEEEKETKKNKKGIII
jgi:hypothetical protein